MPYTVKAAATLAGVSVRTLHHYDHIGLLAPNSLSEAGYRLYTDDDLARLQQILFFRELGFELAAIGKIVDAPGFDRQAALQTHRKLLREKQRRLAVLLDTVDRTIDALTREVDMEPKTMFEGFDSQQQREWQAEARERWGHTDPYQQSQARTAQYTKADWAEIKREGDAIYRGLAALLDRDPADGEVQGLIKQHHEQLNRRFYDCPLEMYRGLGDMYVGDPRFTANIDKVKPGLAAFLQVAIAAYCDRRLEQP